MLYSKSDLLEALKNQIINHDFDDNTAINHITIDSRTSQKNSCFIAIKGENNDGHNFINKDQLAVIDDKKYFTKNTILVKNSFDALYELAKFARNRLDDTKIIAITGSVGKTSTKEMLKNAFNEIGNTYATKGNLNNHFGLPLTICNAPKNTEFAIFEIGMNNPGEIAPLSQLAKPDIAIITNVTSAHIGNFTSEKDIAIEKSTIFNGLKENGIAIINRDSPHFDTIKTRNCLTFGHDKNSDYQLVSIKNEGNHSKIALKTKNHSEITYKIDSINKGIIENSLIVAACLDLLTNTPERGLEALEKIENIQGRGQIINIKVSDKEITIIDDSYNASLDSMKNALGYLNDLKKSLGKKRSIAILGDMFELGDKSDKIHQETLEFASQNADLIITCGENFKKATKTLAKSYENYLNSKEVAKNLQNFTKNGDILLIKGSRGMKMEKIVTSQ